MCSLLTRGDRAARKPPPALPAHIVHAHIPERGQPFFRVHLGGLIQQPLEHSSPASSCSHMYGRPALLPVDRKHIGAMCKQVCDALCVPVTGCAAQSVCCCEAVRKMCRHEGQPPACVSNSRSIFNSRSCSLLLAVSRTKVQLFLQQACPRHGIIAAATENSMILQTMTYPSMQARMSAVSP